MRMYRIEIDEEVYNYLKEKAEPFIDSPNSVLRRELFGNKAKLKQAQNKDTLPAVPAGTPKALEEILQVVYLIRNSNLHRYAATHKVASMHRVVTQTIIDKYTRQLGLTALQFDKLLEQPDLSDLKKLLNKRFSEHQAVIKAYVGD